MSHVLTFASFNALGFPYGLNLKPQPASIRFKAIGEYFSNSDAQVVNFQEIISYAHLSFIKKNLKNFPFATYRKSYFGPRGGLVTFSKIPLEFVSFQDFHKSFYPFDRSMVEALITKGMLVSGTLDKKMIFLNTHLATTHDEDWTENGRYFAFMKRQIFEFHEYMKKMRLLYPRASIVASGDFNISRESILYRTLTNLPGLSDVFSKKNLPTYHKPFVRFGDPYCIDYIFTYGKNKLSVKNQKHIFTERIMLNRKKIDFASDHVGLQMSAY